MIAAVDHFLETAQPVLLRRALDPIQMNLERQTAAIFKRQGAIFTNHLARISRYFPVVQETLATRDWEPLWDQTAGQTESELHKRIREAALAALLAAISISLAGLRSQLTERSLIALPGIQTYLHETPSKHAALIGNTTRTRLTALMTKAATEGWSYPRTSAAVQALFLGFAGEGVLAPPITSRAALIGSYEVYDAAGFGTAQAAAEFQAQTAVGILKAWATMQDKAVCLIICLPNEAAGWIPLDITFPSGHSQPLGHPQCRCVALLKAA
jgi:hypothetical protein